MKKLLIGVGLVVGILGVWCGFVALRKDRETGRITSEEMSQFRRYLRLARRELAIHSMEETGEMDRLSREFTDLARKAQGERAEEFRAYAAYFKEFVDLNRERATAAGIMKDPAFRHFATVRDKRDLLTRHEDIARLQTTVDGARNKVLELEPFMRAAMEKRGMGTNEARMQVSGFVEDLRPDTQFVLELCRIHTDYSQNMSNVIDLLITELGHWAVRNDGTVIFRRQHAFEAYGIMGQRSRAIVEEDRALRRQNLNEVASPL